VISPAARAAPTCGRLPESASNACAACTSAFARPGSTFNRPVRNAAATFPSLAPGTASGRSSRTLITASRAASADAIARLNPSTASRASPSDNDHAHRAASSTTAVAAFIAAIPASRSCTGSDPPDTT